MAGSLEAEVVSLGDSDSAVAMAVLRLLHLWIQNLGRQYLVVAVAGVSVFFRSVSESWVSSRLLLQDPVGW